MFTGIVESLGLVKKIIKHQDYWDISIKTNFDSVKLGESILVNGVCLTIVEIDDYILSFQIILETLNKSSLDLLDIDHEVNLERSMKINDRLDGHLVQGHIESIGKVLSKHSNDGQTKITIEIEQDLLKYCIYKGSITFDGVSLTISKIASCLIEVSIIPYTLANTTLGSKSVGDYVNVETDMIAKYVARQMDFKK
tara:strand:+ start:398 stop:985 length:588 start_codon:yes stop_codon:yes gene_type:complete